MFASSLEGIERSMLVMKDRYGKSTASFNLGTRIISLLKEEDRRMDQ
jgi:hypothetical protein